MATNNQLREFAIKTLEGFEDMGLVKIDGNIVTLIGFEISDSDENHTAYLKSKECEEYLIHKFPRLTENGIRKEIQKMIDYIESKGKRYKNYKAFSTGWIRRSEDKIMRRAIIVAPIEIDNKALDKLEQLRDKYKFKGIG